MRARNPIDAGWRHGVAVAALCALVGVIGSALLLRAESERLVEDAGLRLARYAEVMADRLDAGLADWASDVGQLARFEAVQRQPPDPPLARRLLEDLRARSPTFSWIGFAGVDGRVIAATGGLLEGVDVSARPWFRPGLAGLHLGDVHTAVMLAKLLPADQGGGEGAYFVDAAAPVHAADGTLLGVIAGHLTWRWADAVRRELASVAPWQPAPALRVLGADGMVLLGPEPERGRPWEGATADGGWREASPPGQPAAIRGFARSGRAPDRPSLGWVVVAETGRGPVLAPLLPFGLWLAFGTLSMAVLGGLLAGWYARRMGATITRVLGGEDHGDLAQKLERLRDQAWRDPLTGLLNRAGFAAWCEAHPGLDSGAAVLVLDLDGFKPINDTHGHAAGDAVLRGIGAWLQQSLRAEDAVVRLGGDEFLVCLAGVPEQTEAAIHEVGRLLEARLRDGLATEAGLLRLGCSLGIALLPRDAVSIGAAIEVADAALYEVKRRRTRPAPEAVPARA